jgi:DNA-binding NarL/FixJ family response regulator
MPAAFAAGLGNPHGGGAAEVMALCEVDAVLAQQLHGRFILHVLGDGLFTEALSQVDHRLDQVLILPARSQVSHELDIDLEVVDGHGLQVAATLAEAERMLEMRVADVAIVDVNLQGESGFGLIPKARARGMKVLLYTGETLPAPLSDADKADGVASKSGGPGELIDAIHEVAAGRTPTDSRVQERSHEARLTAREREIVGFLAQGVCGEKIAEQLFLSGHTVRTHVRNAMTKTNARTRAHLVSLAAEAGEIATVGV